MKREENKSISPLKPCFTVFSSCIISVVIFDYILEIQPGYIRGVISYTRESLICNGTTQQQSVSVTFEHMGVMVHEKLPLKTVERTLHY